MNRVPMDRAVLRLFVLLLLAAAARLPAATILERSLEIEISPDGRVVERTRLRVRLDTDNDVAAWARVPISLDQNRVLESLSAGATRPDGRVLTVAAGALDRVDHAAASELHSSRQLQVVHFPAVPAGSILSLDSVIRVSPWFPSGLVRLAAADPTESLRIEVRGGGAGWRWRLDGKLAGLEVRETADGVIVTGRGLPRSAPPELAPDGGAVLRYAWGEVRTWEGLGRWYGRLVSGIPHDSAAVRATARELTAGKAGRREKAEALVAFVRRQVRYVAVEVGIGGLRPGVPQEVLERRWGDCKDKAFLLVDLLREAGIEAWPVLLRAGAGGRVDRDFPAPDQLNHAIVAVAPAGLGLDGEAPVSGGFLFLDATQGYGGLAWLQPAAQDQDALVIQEGRGLLVRTPVRPGQERSRLAVDFASEPGGAASGRLSGAARLDLEGEVGAAFLDLVAGGRPEEVERATRLVFGQYFPGGEVGEPRWTTRETGVPGVTLSARVRLPAEVPGPGGWPEVSVPRDNGLPAAALLDGREIPIVTAPYVSEIAWRMELPAGACPPAAGQSVVVDNDLGGFRQQVTVEAGHLRLERHVELRRRWIEPADFIPLKEISLVSQRAGKRRLRGDCEPATGRR